MSDQPKVSVDAIGTAPVEPTPIGPVKPHEDPLTGKPDPKLSQHLGMIGKVVGGGPEKAGNIAALVIVCALAILIIAAWSSSQVNNEKLIATLSTIQAGCFSLITGALGYLFGSKRD